MPYVAAAEQDGSITITQRELEAAFVKQNGQGKQVAAHSSTVAKYGRSDCGVQVDLAGQRD